MASSTAPTSGCVFCDILNGAEPGTVVARDERRRLALIQSIHPEATIHWMAVPAEHVESTEALERSDRQRFLDLVDFAINATKELAPDYPQLTRGFSIKVHFGSFETVPHAKLHILNTE